MRKLTFVFAVTACLLFACKKHSDLPIIGTDSGCIEQDVIALNAHPGIPDAGYNLAISLLKNAGLYKDNFQIMQVSTADDISQLYNPDADIFRTIGVRQYANGLPMFGQDLYFVFQKNTLRQDAPGQRFGATLNLNTTPRLNTANIRKLFTDDIKRLDPNNKNYIDSCFATEFGYYNLTSNAAININPIHFIKAWHISPKNNAYWNAYYKDDTGELIWYYNGTFIP